MNKLFSHLPFFVAVAKNKSFTQAADLLDMPVPTISRRITALKNSLGIRLFSRNSRKVELTEAGKTFFERCEYIVAEASDAVENLLDEQRNQTGRIRLALPGTAYFTYMQGALSAFTAQYPGITMHVYLTTRWVDLYSEPFDLEIRAGALPDSDLSVRKLFTSVMGVYASPELLSRYSQPDEPCDLARMPYIHIALFPEHCLWLRNGSRQEKVLMSPVHIVNAPSVAQEFVLAGQGIATLEEGTAWRFVRNGRLVRLLPEWSAAGVDINLVRVNGKLPHRIQLFVEHLVQHFKKFRQNTLKKH